MANLSATGSAPALPDASPVASIAVDAPPETILALCAAAPQGDAQVFGATIDGIAFQFGWHAVTANKTMLHASISDGSDVQSALATLYNLRTEAERKVAA